VVADAASWDDTRRSTRCCWTLPARTGTSGQSDVLWNARPGDIASLVQTQARCSPPPPLAPRRARLVYSVCSLEREEGETSRDLPDRQPDFALDPIAAGEVGSPAFQPAPQGWLASPHHLEGGLDGFFIARFRARPDQDKAEP